VHFIERELSKTPKTNDMSFRWW